MNLKKIKLPSGKEVELVEYVEAGIVLDLPKQSDRVEFLLKNLIVSFEGSKENVYEGIRKLNLKDYRDLDNELTKLMDNEEEGLKV